MNAKEKALKLVEKMQKSIDSLNGVPASKQCAIIAVDEILDIDCTDMSEGYFYTHFDYYQQVKQEIEKL